MGCLVPSFPWLSFSLKHCKAEGITFWELAEAKGKTFWELAVSLKQKATCCWELAVSLKQKAAFWGELAVSLKQRAELFGDWLCRLSPPSPGFLCLVPSFPWLSLPCP